MAYTELQITSNFSFLRGASHPEEMVEQAAALGYQAIALTDRNSLAGVVRAFAAAKKAGIRLITGCRLDLQDGPSLLAYPINLNGYHELCELLSSGNRRTVKGDCMLFKKELMAKHRSLKLIVVPPDKLTTDFELPIFFADSVKQYAASALGADLYIGMTHRFNGEDEKMHFRLAQLAAELGLLLVATNDVHYHIKERRQLQDVLTCIREKCTIQEAGFRLYPNAERHLKSAAEITRLFRRCPEAIANSQRIADACTFSLAELKYEYPEEHFTKDRNPLEELTRLVWEGARERFPEQVPEKVKAAIVHELAFTRKMDYAPYFLTVYDIVRFAKSQNILCQGRGSAANSTICYCLGITAVNPAKFDLLFERFVSSSRNEPPDIDVDFEHERREEVIQYIYEKYGRDHAAIVATVTCQHQRGALRDVGKAMGLSLDTLSRLSACTRPFSDEWFGEERLLEHGLNPKDPHLLKTLQLAGQFLGFPRQLGQHTGGFVIARDKLSRLCPIHNARMAGRTCIEWNKDDVDTVGFMKVDVLALGMLTCIRKAFDLVRQHYDRVLTMAQINETEDDEVYAMISRADTIGVFQIESRAQQTMLPRLKPKTFYDLVIEVAIVRPGPIQGGMVHPYLRRRNGEEKVSYPSPEVEKILHNTLGVPLFQEQAMKIAIEAADFTPTEADELRRSMATFRAKGQVKKLEQKLVQGMINKGYTQDYAERVFRQLEGFGSYGFPESHAASFALLVYVSSWLKYHYPDVFACALLNSQPMGFYQPAQLVRDAQEHQVVVRPVDINHSVWDNTLEEMDGRYHALRLGFRQAKGLRQEDMDLLVAHRNSDYESIHALRAAGLSDACLEKLADADAFRSLGLDRRQALWQITAHDHPQALFAGQEAPDGQNEQAAPPTMFSPEHVLHDYAATALSLRAHPVSFLRPKLDQLGILPASSLAGLVSGTVVKVAGLVLIRQRPGTAGGVCFLTIEDETGIANLVVYKNLFQSHRKAVVGARLLMAEGRLQVEGQVIHLIVSDCHDFSPLLRTLLPAQEKGDNTGSSGQHHVPDARSFR